MDIGTAIGLAKGLSDGKSVGDSSSITTAKAVGASADGMVTVILDGDETPIQVPTVSNVGQGDDVLVNIRDGSASAVGAFGSGDKVADTAEAAQAAAGAAQEAFESVTQHFYHDETGAHIDSDAGNRLDMTAEGIEFHDDSGDLIAKFGGTVKIGFLKKFIIGGNSVTGPTSTPDGVDEDSPLVLLDPTTGNYTFSPSGHITDAATRAEFALVNGGDEKKAIIQAPTVYVKGESVIVNGSLYVAPNGITVKPNAAKSLSTTFSAVALAQVANVNSDLFSISGNRITCAKAGYIVVDANGFANNVASRQFAQVGLFVGGVQSSDFPLVDAFNGGASAFYAAFSGTGIVHVNAGNYLEFRAKTSSGTASLDVQSRFTARYISIDPPTTSGRVPEVD